MDRFVDFIKRKASPKPSRQPIRSDEPADITSGRRDFREEADVTPDREQILSFVKPMKRFFKTKREESPKPARQPIRSQEPAEIAAGPPNVPAEVDDTPDGGQNPSYEGLQADRADLTVPQDEEGEMGSRVVVRDTTDGDQELPASGASTSAIAIDDDGHRNQPATEGSSDTGGNTEPMEPSTDVENTRKNALPEGAKRNAEKFGPLKIILGKIPPLFTDRTESDAVSNRVANLLWRITVLEERFDSPPSGVPEQRRRGVLISGLDEIKVQLRSASEKLESLRLDDHVQAGEDVFKLLEDLQEAILDYQMAQQTASDSSQGFIPIDSAEATILKTIRSAQEAEYRHGNRGDCLRGTRTAILDKIELWTRNFDKPSVYWLNGLAGTGKSTIAQTIARRTFADGRLGASFFCSRDFEDRSNLRSIFPTVAVQLARKYTQFRSIFIRLVESDPEIIHESLYDQMKKLIVQPLAESTISTVIVIDALDECKDEEPASAILSVLGKFVAEIPTVKFFITGRPESRIREGFRLPLLAEATDVFVLHEVEPGQVNDDIRLFFTHSFSELKRHRRGLDDWPTGEQVDLLCERAGGLFVHAVATVRFINHKINSPKKQLDRLLQSQGNSAFEGKTKFRADATIDSLYASILQEAFGGDDQENDHRVRSVLGAVVLATNPLSPSSIATLLGFEPEEVYAILSLVPSLLVLQEDIDQPVRPFHKSFPDFVADPDRCANPRFQVCPPDQHTELLVGCLETMNRELERNMCNLPDGVANSEVIDLKERTQKYIGKGLEYACRSWHKHLVGGTIPAHVIPVLHKFLEEKFLFWLEVLSVLGVAREAVDALEAAEECEWPEVSPTLNLVHDCTRFVLKFFSVISLSAPHIYHSALPLSPPTSIIHELYKQHASPFFRVVKGGVPDSWQQASATATFDHLRGQVVWSPCNRFVAVVRLYSVEVVDSVTLNQLGIFQCNFQCSDYELLGFSPDSHYLTLVSSSRTISWDLQTGGPLSAIPSEELSLVPYSFTHSNDGKAVAVAYSRDTQRNFMHISTYSVLSGTHIGSTNHSPKGQVIYPIWTHDDEYFQFATIDLKSITIWQSPFSLEHPAVEVESLPIPDEIASEIASGDCFLFLPALSRLAFILKDTVKVWDAKGSKLLLEYDNKNLEETSFSAMSTPLRGSFSSDGHFFAHMKTVNKVCVWKESTTGYVLHQYFSVFSSSYLPWPSLSPNGKSIIMPLDSKIHRMDTRNQISSGPSILTDYHNNLLDFSTNENLAAFAQRRDNIVTILDLKSGEPRSIINVGIEIDCLGITGSTIIVVSGEKAITWSLSGRNHTVNASTNESMQTITLNYQSSAPDTGYPIDVLISPDLSHIVVSKLHAHPDRMEVYDASTGKFLAETEITFMGRPHFSPDGCNIWASDHYSLRGKQYKINKDGETGHISLEAINAESPSMVPPWKLPYSCEATEDGWILSPTKNRLLWLPHHWRVAHGNRVWGEHFLGLLPEGELLETTILEFFE